MDAAGIAAALVTYSVQVAVIIGVSALACAVVRPGPAGARLAFWRFVVLVCVIVPLLATQSNGGGQLRMATEVVFTLSVAAIRVTASRPWGNALVDLVLIGIALRLLWLAGGVLGLQRLRGNSSEAHLSAEIDAWRQRLAPRAALRVHATLTQPVTFGWRRPVVLLPRAIGDLSIEAQRGVVCHELLHVARRDWLWLWLEEGIRTALWFHPAMHWAIAQVELGREETVDARVVALTGHRRAYMTALMQFADRQTVLEPALPFMRRRHVVQRMKSLRKEGTMSQARIAMTGAVLSLVVASTGWAVALTPKPPRALTSGATAVQQAERVYKAEDGVKLPMVIRQVQPTYPPDAMAAGVTGTVILECVVGAGGAVNDVTVARSLDTVYGLDAESVKALKQWRFRPGTKDGKPVAVRVQVELRFELK